MRWLIDGNNVYGSRPDGWWNDRQRAATRLAQSVAEWCRTHDDDVMLVFDAPVADHTRQRGGGNLEVVEAPHRGRDGADDEIVRLAHETVDGAGAVTVVTSDKGLRRRLPARVEVLGAGGSAN